MVLWYCTVEHEKGETARLRVSSNNHRSGSVHIIRINIDSLLWLRIVMRIILFILRLTDLSQHSRSRVSFSNIMHPLLIIPVLLYRRFFFIHHFSFIIIILYHLNPFSWVFESIQYICLRRSRGRMVVIVPACMLRETH